MKIKPPVNTVTAALEAWALDVSWKHVGLAVAEAYHAAGGGGVLPELDSEEGLKNAVQRVKRIFRGHFTKRYAPMAWELLDPALAALPLDIRASLTQPEAPALLASRAAKEGIEAVNAVNLGATTGEILKEINEAIEAFVNLKNRCLMAG